MIKRILPHSIEAEQSVIGSMILDRDAILVASEILTSDDFYQSQYGVLFDAMLERALQKNPKVKNILEAPAEQMLVEIAVEGGSRVDGKTLQEIRLPGRALVVCVRRGDQDMIPQADTVLLGGDYVYIIPNHARLHQLNRLFKTKTGEEK